jgi:MFS family permease
VPWSPRYELSVVTVLCLAYGIVSFDMFGINYLMPFIQPSMKLSNLQIGFLVSGFWIAFALSSYLTGAVTDRFGGRKALLSATLILFSLLSVTSGLTKSFLALLAARVLMGLVEGPILPLVQSIIALGSPVQRRGMNMGIVQSLGSSILGLFIAPLFLVFLATHYRWQYGFFVVAPPGLICAVLVAYIVREPPRFEVDPNTDGASEPEVSRLRDVLRSHNIWLCAAGSCLTVAYVTIGSGFLPLFYVKVRQFSPQQMSTLMSALGISSLALGIVLPAISDRIGRKQLAIVASIAGMVCPLAAVYYSGPVAVLALLVCIGWAPAGAATLFFATIPAESVPVRSVSTVIGLIVGTGTVVGGVIGPSVAGWSADRWGLNTALLVEVGCTAILALVSLMLRESAPRLSSPAQLAPAPDH